MFKFQSGFKYHYNMQSLLEMVALQIGKTLKPFREFQLDLEPFEKPHYFLITIYKLILLPKSIQRLF